MNSENHDAESAAHCVVCNKKADVTDLFYCLCHTAVCDKCIEQVKVSENEWKCPNCGESMHLKSTKLFREH